MVSISRPSVHEAGSRNGCSGSGLLPTTPQKVIALVMYASHAGKEDRVTEPSKDASNASVSFLEQFKTTSLLDQKK